MRPKTSTILWTFIWCLFMGITVGSIGLGAVFPPVNLITKPFLCSGGEMQRVTQDYHPSPVEVVTTLTWYCVDANTGARQELGLWPMSLIAGTIYGLLFFAVVVAALWLIARRRGPTPNPAGLPELFASDPARPPDPEDLVERTAELRDSTAQLRERLRERGRMSASGTVEQRLRELKSLRDSGLITEQDYARKRTEILDDL